MSVVIGKKSYGVSTFVMESDAHDYAAKIYDLLGFNPVEKTFSLEWWERDD